MSEATSTVGTMTVRELRKLITAQVHEEIQNLVDEFEISDETMEGVSSNTVKRRTLDEIRESVRKNRWTPPPGAKSSLELLREDRER
jgi:hypothetical protein